MLFFLIISASASNSFIFCLNQPILPNINFSSSFNCWFFLSDALLFLFKAPVFAVTTFVFSSSFFLCDFFVLFVHFVNLLFYFYY